MSAKPRLTHLDSRGNARMVDVSLKPPTLRRAAAEAKVHLNRAAWQAIHSRRVAKGDAAAVARIAGIQAAKRTSELIPLCHPIPLDSVSVEIKLPRPGLVHITAEAVTHGPTGVEMEALTAVSIAALAIYDMCKALDRGITIDPVRLLEKSGGRSGFWSRKSKKVP